MTVPPWLFHRVCHARLLLSEHWDAAQVTKDGAEGPEEPLFLHQEITLDTFSTHIQLSEDEIPVAGMWCQADNVLVGMVFCYFSRPSHSFV